MRVMTTIDLPLSAPHPRYRRALIGLLLAMFLGLLSLAAVQAMRVECRSQPDCFGDGSCLAVGEGNAVLGTGTNTKQCQLVMGDVRVPLPEWALSIIK
jgi:hypothetical protein